MLCLGTAEFRQFLLSSCLNLSPCGNLCIFLLLFWKIILYCILRGKVGEKKTSQVIDGVKFNTGDFADLKWYWLHQANVSNTHHFGYPTRQNPSAWGTEVGEYYKVEARLDYIANTRPAWAIEWDQILKRQGLKHGLVVKRIYCSSRGPQFDSEKPHQASLGIHTHTQHIQTYTHTYTPYTHTVYTDAHTIL